MSVRRELLGGLPPRAAVGGEGADPAAGHDVVGEEGPFAVPENRVVGDERASDTGRPVDPVASETEILLEVGLRPRRLADFIGQEELKERLAIVLEAASRRGQAVDHLLFAGPPGLGKTTLAGIVAAEMAAGFRVTSGPALVRTGDVAAILTDLQPGDILFIDEIHRLGRAVEEVLYPAMEDFALDVMLGKGPSARSIRLDLPRFTLVGATTRTGLVTGPLRDRFGFVARLDHYNAAELEAIVLRSARLLGVELTPDGAAEIAARSRGTPRLAIRLLRRVRDFVEVRGSGVVTLEAARQGLEAFGVDDLGLDRLDRTILETLCVRFPGRPVGLSTLAVTVGEETETVEDVYEPFLLKAGLLMRTPRGRLATPAAYAHLGLVVPPYATGFGALGPGDDWGAGPPRSARRGRAEVAPKGPSLFDAAGPEPPRRESTPTSG